MARIIGAMIVLLLTGGSAFGQFIVQPVKIMLSMPPGRRTITEFHVENVNPDRSEMVDFRLVDLTQDPNGMWQPIEADETFDRSKLRSCQSWLQLGKLQVQVAPLRREPVRLTVTVPPGTRGYYCAAIMARALIQTEETEGLSSAVLLEFLIPVILEVQGRPEPQDIKITDVGLAYVPQTMLFPAATTVTMDIGNMGGTYSLLKGYTRIWGQFGGRWRKLMDVELRDASIIPGSHFRIAQDVGRPLPRANYKVEGFLFVDGRRASTFSNEFEFRGDPRAMTVKGEAPVDLDPIEMFIDMLPGQTRTQTLLIANAGEDPITVTVGASLPPHLESAAAGALRGPEFGCIEWLEVTPKQFTLQGYARQNLRVVARMPQTATAFPNYYAVVNLHTKYADGSEGGTRRSRLCVQNRQARAAPRIEGMRLVVSEASRARYFVTAQFGNFGDTHIQPTCRAALTAVTDNRVHQTIRLDSEVYERTGILLPLETRSFQGILDVAGVPPGLYRLTADLKHDKGPSAQIQIALEVSGGDETKTVRSFNAGDLTGGVTKIDL